MSSETRKQKPARIIGNDRDTHLPLHAEQTPLPNPAAIGEVTLEPKPLGRLLFKDVETIRQIRDYVVATSTHTAPEEYRLRGTPAQYFADPLLLMPSAARWLHVPAKASEACGNEFELEWGSSLDNEVNYDHLAMVLASVVPSRKSVEEVFRCIEKQIDADLVHPNMPIRIHGRLNKPSDIARSSILLRADPADQFILVKCNRAHHLSWSAGLFSRHIFVLGVVGRIDYKIVVTAGALML
jgi:hypothetical protein